MSVQYSIEEHRRVSLNGHTEISPIVFHAYLDYIPIKTEIKIMKVTCPYYKHRPALYDPL